MFGFARQDVAIFQGHMEVGRQGQGMGFVSLGVTNSWTKNAPAKCMLGG